MYKMDYNKTEYERICEECMLSYRQSKILYYRCRGYDNIAISEELCIGTATLSREIKKINVKIARMV